MHGGGQRIGGQLVVYIKWFFTSFTIQKASLLNHRLLEAEILFATSHICIMAPTKAKARVTDGKAQTRYATTGTCYVALFIYPFR